jgi:hypothetical protein
LNLVRKAAFTLLFAKFPAFILKARRSAKTEANLTDALGLYLLHGLEDKLSGLKAIDRVEVELQIPAGLHHANAA